MSDGVSFVLPGSGLAEDILTKFIDKAQVEIDQVNNSQAGKQAAMLLHIVTFRLGREEYGVEITSVQEIIRATDINPVPGAPSYVRGVINLRGKIIPVVDLRKRFAMAAADAADDQRIIVVELGEKRIGMLVDSVSQIIKLPMGGVENMPEEAISEDGNFIKVVGKLDARMIIILDLNRSLLLA